MSVLHTLNFGGLVPQAGKRALPDNAAQTATNLLASSQEFRPLQADTEVVTASGVSNPKTIYRLQRKADGSLNTDHTSAATWKVNALEVSYARHQLNNDVTERTSLTYNDGSAPARVIDALATDRLLGVPKPTAAPTVVVTEVAEFTTDERNANIEAIANYVRNIATVNVTPVWRGSPSLDSADYRPGWTHDGYADRDYIPGVDPEEAQQLRLFRTTSTGGANNGTISDTYTDLPTEGLTWPFDPALGGFWKTATADWGTWAGTTHDHWCIPFHAYGLTYDIDVTALGTALALMEMPNGNGLEDRLLTTEQVAEIVDQVGDLGNQQWTDVAPKLNALYAKVNQAKVLLDGGTAAALVSATAAFYAKTEIEDIFTDAVANAAEAIWAQAVQAATYVDWVPYPGDA